MIFVVPWCFEDFGYPMFWWIWEVVSFAKKHQLQHSIEFCLLLKRTGLDSLGHLFTPKDGFFPSNKLLLMDKICAKPGMVKTKPLNSGIIIILGGGFCPSTVSSKSIPPVVDWPSPPRWEQLDGSWSRKAGFWWQSKQVFWGGGKDGGSYFLDGGFLKMVGFPHFTPLLMIIFNRKNPWVCWVPLF